MKYIFLFCALIPLKSISQVISTFVTVDIYDPNNLVFDNVGNLYVEDYSSNKIAKVDTSRVSSYFIGSMGRGFGGDGGPASAALINSPGQLAINPNGDLFFTDIANNRVRKVDLHTGIINTVAGSDSMGFSGDGGPATNAKLHTPNGLCFDKYGNMYIADCWNERIRKVDTFGIISTYAGNGLVGWGRDGGAATNAYCNPVHSMCTDKFGNLYIVDNNNVIRKVDTLGIIYTVAGDTSSFVYNGDGIPATSATFAPANVYIDSFQQIYICDYFPNNRIRMVDTFGIIHTIAGNGVAATTGDGGTDDSAEVNHPCGINMDVCGNLYFGQIDDVRIRKISLPPRPISLTDSLIVTSDTICVGTSVIFSAIATSSSGSINFQWYVNGIIVGATSSIYSYLPGNGDSIRCVVTSLNSCTSAIKSSNTIHMLVNPSTTPTLSIAAHPGDTICSGTSVSYTVSGGAVPYQWIVNSGMVSGATTSSYAYTPVNSDSIRCTVAASGCNMGGSSNEVRMVVNPSTAYTLTTTAHPGDTVCAGTAVSYSVSGGAVPYQWIANSGMVSGATGSSYTYTPANGDSIRCTEPASGCNLGGSSNMVYMVVMPYITPTITITASPTAAAVGSVVTVTATFTGAGSSYTITWYDNGSFLTTSSVPTITYTKTSDTDHITATILPATVYPDCYDSAVSNVLVVRDSSLAITSPYPLVRGNLFIYPNPAGSVVHVDGLSADATYTLMNMLGQVVQRGMVQQGWSSISLTGINTGIYMLQIINERESGVYRVLKE